MFKIIRSSTPEDLAPVDRHQWPLHFVATHTVDDTPAKIFVMQRQAPGEFLMDMFSCVASAIQMDDLPEDAPATGVPFFRVNDITVLCRNPEAASEFSRKLLEAVQDLANNIQAATVLVEDLEITITPDLNV